MKILIIGGIAQSLINFRKNLIEDLLNRKHRVYTIAGETSGKLRHEMVTLGVEHFDVAMNRTGINPLSDFNLMVELNRLIKIIQPDAVFTYTIKPVIYGSLAAKWNRVKVIVAMVTGIGYVFTNSGFSTWVLASLCRILYWMGLKACHTVIFQNSDDRELFLKRKMLGSNKDARIVNGSGVDLKHYQNCSLPKKIRFLLVARLLYSKGIVEYIEAAKFLKQKYPDIEFVLVGSSDINPDCIPVDVIKSSVADGIIDYYGYLEDVRSIVAKASVYVLPSYREGMPRTVLEAMSMGRAIITTNTAGCKETIKLTGTKNKKKERWIIEGLNGFLCPVKDTSALCKAMEQFIVTPTLIESMGSASYAYAKEKYDVKIINYQILEALRAL